MGAKDAQWCGGARCPPGFYRNLFMESMWGIRMSGTSPGAGLRGSERTVGALAVVLQGGDGIPAPADIPEGEAGWWYFQLIESDDG